MGDNVYISTFEKLFSVFLYADVKVS